LQCESSIHDRWELDGRKRMNTHGHIDEACLYAESIREVGVERSCWQRLQARDQP
jgi:hypothetical protein